MMDLQAVKPHSGDFCVLLEKPEGLTLRSTELALCPERSAQGGISVETAFPLEEV